MPGKWRFTDRTRLLLTLELAIMLPAALLMFFSISNLHHIQRDKAIEAAIQRDFSYVLKIAERKTWHKAADMLTPVRKKFPCADDAATIKPQLDAMLAAHPEFLYAILYDKDHDLFTWRLQPAREGDEAFRKRMAESLVAFARRLEAPGKQVVIFVIEDCVKKLGMSREHGIELGLNCGCVVGTREFFADRS